MAKYTVTARQLTYLTATVEAESEDHAKQLAMAPEFDGFEEQDGYLDNVTVSEEVVATAEGRKKDVRS